MRPEAHDDIALPGEIAGENVGDVDPVGVAHEVTEDPVASAVEGGHGTVGDAAAEARTNHHVAKAAVEWLEQAQDLATLVGVITIEHHDVFGVLGDTGKTPADGVAFALPALGDDAGAGGLGHRGGVVAGVIVDDEHI